MERKMKSDCWR